MDRHDAVDPPPLCPSAQPEQAEGVLFGVVAGTVDAPRVAYLADPQPITPTLLAHARPVVPTEVFRFAAPCAGCACVHFDGAACRLARRVVRLLPVAADRPPPCRIRPRCRWWRQEGVAACLRCPQVVTEAYAPSAAMQRAANPVSNDGTGEPTES